MTAPSELIPAPDGVLEVAHLDLQAGRSGAFERAFAAAVPLLARTPGYRWHRLLRCHEVPDRYLLLVGWDSLEAHETGFRAGPDYPAWRDLLHGFYHPFPTVEHYRATGVR